MTGRLRQPFVSEPPTRVGGASTGSSPTARGRLCSSRSHSVSEATDAGSVCRKWSTDRNTNIRLVTSSGQLQRPKFRQRFPLLVPACATNRPDLNDLKTAQPPGQKGAIGSRSEFTAW